MIIGEIGNNASFDLSGLGKYFAAAREFLLSGGCASLPVGNHAIVGDDVFVMIQEYTQQEKEPAYEVHDVYADIQLVLQGSERFRWGYGEAGPLTGDLRAVTRVEPFVEFTLRENQFAIFLPGEAHAPGLPEKGPAFCRKAVIKVRMED